jgi:type II secretory pathway pseudopilin PulG
MSLVEVVVGIALMGTLAASAVLAASSHFRQLRSAKLKQHGVELIDRFLVQWSRHNFRADSIEFAARDSNVLLADYPNHSTAGLRTDPYETDTSGDQLALQINFGADIPQLNGRECQVLARSTTGTAVAHISIVVRKE